MSEFAVYGPGPFTVETFRPWLESRSPEERWELVEGVAMMSPAPRLEHQRIASNLERLLNDALSRAKPEWHAEREIGIEVADDSSYRPEPEITVIDTYASLDPGYPDRFYLAVEVVSESDKGRVIAAKVEFYKSHSHARWIIVIQQTAVDVEVHERRSDGTWRSLVLRNLSDRLSLGEIGEVCSVLDMYRLTRFDPAYPDATR